MGRIKSNALAPRHRPLLHRMTWMSRIGGSVAKFNIATSERFKKIQIWSGLILFVKKSNPTDSFIPKNEGMAEGAQQSALAARRSGRPEQSSRVRRPAPVRCGCGR